MSEDKIKQTPQSMPQEHRDVKTAHDNYQQHKYNDWIRKKQSTHQKYTISGDSVPDPSKPNTYVANPNGTPSPIPLGIEQTAFEDYLAKANANGFKVLHPADRKDLRLLTSGANQKRYVYKLKDNDFNPSPAFNVGDSVLIYFGQGDVTDYPNRTLTIYAKVLEIDTSNKRVVVETFGFAMGDEYPKNTMILKYMDNATTSLAYIKGKIASDDPVYLNFNQNLIGDLAKQGGHLRNDYLIITIPANKLTDSDVDVILFGVYEGYMSATSPKQLKIKVMGYSTNATSSSAPQPQPPTPTPGGGGRPPIVIPADDMLHQEEGAFGLNLFNYRDLTYNTDISVNGNIFYNKRPSEAEHNDTGGDKNKRVRVRNKDSVNFKWRMLKTNTTKSDIEFVVSDTQGEFFALDFQRASTPIRIWKKETKPNNKKYAYATYSLGSNKSGGHNEKTMSSIQVKAWYGDIEPNVLDQGFVFKHYNGVELMALQPYNPVNGNKLDVEKDSYKIYRRKTTITKKLGLCKLKDCSDYLYKQNGDKLHLLIPIPDDCKDNTTHLMSNNLCDISATESEQSLPAEVRPFFVRTLTPETFSDIQRDTSNGDTVIYDETGKPLKTQVSKQCFTIMIKKDEIRNWKYLLDETEIIYELDDKHNKETQLPEGGQIYVLDDGARIYTCMYSKVDATIIGSGKKKSAYSIDFKGSPFGLQDTTIMVENISQIINNTGITLPEPLSILDDIEMNLHNYK